LGFRVDLYFAHWHHVEILEDFLRRLPRLVGNPAFISPFVDALGSHFGMWELRGTLFFLMREEFYLLYFN
jgi:hypothetical protein